LFIYYYLFITILDYDVKNEKLHENILQNILRWKYVLMKTTIDKINL